MNPDQYHIIPLDDLREHAQGLFLLTGGDGGPLSRLLAEGRRDAAAWLLDALKDSAEGVACFPVSEYWMDVGRIDDLERARDEFEQHF